MEVNATAQCSFGEKCGLKTPLCSAFTLPDNQLLCCNAALKCPRLCRATPFSTTVTLTNALLTQPASLCQRFSQLAKYVGVHTVTRRTYYSVTLITVIYIYIFFFFLWIKIFIATLIPSCYWVNPVKTVFVVLVFWGIYTQDSAELLL